MSTKLYPIFCRRMRRLPWARLLLLAGILAVQTGCATSDADLDYTRDKPLDTTSDHSYHGWNNANY